MNINVLVFNFMTRIFIQNLTTEIVKEKKFFNFSSAKQSYSKITGYLPVCTEGLLYSVTSHRSRESLHLFGGRVPHLEKIFPHLFLVACGMIIPVTVRYGFAQTYTFKYFFQNSIKWFVQPWDFLASLLWMLSSLLLIFIVQYVILNF